MSVNINTSTNNITINNSDKVITVNNNNQSTSVNITQPITDIVTVATVGPQGPVGPPGPVGTVNTSSFATTGSNNFVGNQVITGSLIVTQEITGSLFGTSSFAISSSRAISSSFALTASYLENYIPPFPFTGSATITGSLTVTGSIISTTGITGSLFGTASFATSASFAISSSRAISSSFALTSSFSSQATSASYALTASYLENNTPPFPFTGSANITGSLGVIGTVNITGSLNVTNGITGSLFGTASFATQALSASFATTASFLNTLNQNLTFNGNLTLNGTASIGTLVVNQTALSTGSNQLGDAVDDIQTLFGSVIIPTGSLTVTGSIISTTGITGSLFGTASWAQNALTASYITPIGTNAFVQGGNSFGTTALLGTNDNNNLAFETSGSIRMFISSSGNVGIGTTASKFDLTVRDGGRIGSDYILNSYIEFGNAIGLVANYNTYTLKNLAVGVGDMAARLGVRGSGATASTTALRVENSSATPSLVVLDNSFVGIGTATPSASLHVRGSGSASTTTAFRVENSNASASLIVTDDGQTTFGNSSAWRIIIDPTSGTNPGGYISYRGSDNFVYFQQYMQSAFVNYLTTAASSYGFRWYAQGTEALRISSVANVGIGLTSNPTTKFQVRGSGATASTTALRIENSSATPLLRVQDNGLAIISGSLELSGSRFDMFNNAAAYGGLTLNSNATSTMYVGAQSIFGQVKADVTNGSVFYGAYTGAGITRLGYSGSAGGATFINFSTNGANTGLHITHNNSPDLMTVTGAGNVGIGRTPTSSLDVAGTTRLSSSFNTAISGSTLTVIGSGSAQPIFTVQGSQGELFSITDSLSGSLFSVNDISGLPIMEVFSDNTILMGDYQDPMLLTTRKIAQTNSGSFIVYSIPTASYDGAFIDYTIKSGSNARAGTIMSTWAGSSIEFTEVDTMDIGSTSAVGLTMILSGSNAVMTGSSSTGAWTIRTIIRTI
jgi:hypothetical protein